MPENEDSDCRSRDRLLSPDQRINGPSNPERERVFAAYRQWGYLEGDLDPLGFLRPRATPELEREGEYAREARAIYSSTIGVEINHIYSPERRSWIYERMESACTRDDEEDHRTRILDLLTRADIFEQVMQQRYLGSKRFSLEGITALIPLVDEVLDTASRLGAIEFVMGMSHRGRLNVIAHVAQASAAGNLCRIRRCRSAQRSRLRRREVPHGRHRRIRSPKRRQGSHPSRLESQPSGSRRSRHRRPHPRQARPHRRRRHAKNIFRSLVHGDAAFAGQGILAETMNYADLPGYTVGGTIHVVVNNLLGFTTSYTEEHSTRFAACIARRQSIPIFHVNAEDVDAVVRVARLATEYRYEFGTDVVIDLIGYRRHGHSEVDDPTITQPLLYKKIKDHPPLWEIYADDIGVDRRAGQGRRHQGRIRSRAEKSRQHQAQAYFCANSPNIGTSTSADSTADEFEVETGLSPRGVRRTDHAPDHLSRRLSHSPESEKVARAARRDGHRQTSSRLRHGGSPRLREPGENRHARPHVSGQDTRRGTFNQRHSVLIDIENENEYVPLENIAADQARCEIYNSTLSEAGVLGFEYGYSRDYPESLVLWEAQFGDFVNVAQAIIDQFISAGEAKWNLLSGLVMLLPHGYEGQGPEHSSASIERFIQLAAKHNIQIAQPSNAAQYFHLLRRQALRHWRKPLIVFTPKSMLRHPDASSPHRGLHAQEFPERHSRHRRRRSRTHPDLHRQNRPRTPGRKKEKKRHEHRDRLPRAALSVPRSRKSPPNSTATASTPTSSGCRKSPQIMGAMFNMLPRLKRIAGERPVLSVKRSSGASPATGSAKAHEVEQKTLLTLAFTIK